LASAKDVEPEALVPGERAELDKEDVGGQDTEYLEDSVEDDEDDAGEESQPSSRQTARRRRRDTGAEPSSLLGKVTWEEGLLYLCRCRYVWERVIVDEAHVLRNPKTLIAEAIYQTPKRNLHCLTATPLLNHPKDLRGYLHQLFRSKWQLSEEADGLVEQYHTSFNPRSFTWAEFNPGARDNSRYEMESVNLLPPRDASSEELWSANERGIRLYLLDPAQFATLGRVHVWSPAICQTMLPPILKMILLRIGYETLLDLQNGSPPSRVGDSVPRCDLYTIQLGMERWEKKFHDQRTLPYLPTIVASEDEPPDEPEEPSPLKEGPEVDQDGGVQAGVYRYLKHGTFDPRLTVLTQLNHRSMTAAQKAKASKSRVNNWTGVDMDHGASFFFRKTCDGPQYSVPYDRLGLAKYLVSFSVKMRYALGVIATNIRNKEKTCLVFEYPMPLW
jgi:hypothetical protein